MNQEVFVNIPDYPNYSVSNCGEVKNIKTQKMLKPGYTKNYYYVSLINEDGHKNMKLHRLVAKCFIENPNDHEFVDHIDSNVANNSVANLRWVTKQQNNMNSTKRPNTSSTYKGVSFVKNRNKWKAKIQHNYKTINLGDFKEEIEAAKAYDSKAKELFGEFAKLNFPE
jgi:hypothetical protein